MTYERYKFNMCTQSVSESLDSYLSRLRKLSKTCEYADLTDGLIKDRIVVGIRENSVRKRLLQDEKLTLDKCVDMCRAAESTQAKVKSMSGATAVSSEDVHHLKRKVKPHHTPYARKKQEIPNRRCKYCGKDCEKGNCPAFGKRCMTCSKFNHFASECRQGERKEKSRAFRNVRQFDLEDDSESDSYFDIFNRNNGSTKLKIFANMLVVNAQKTLKFQLDSGATANLTAKKYVPKECIEEEENTLRMSDKSELKTYGTCSLTLKNPKTAERFSVQFIIAGDEFTPLLGLAAIQTMQLIEIQYENMCHVDQERCSDLNMDVIQDKYKEMFQGEGCFEGT